MKKIILIAVMALQLGSHAQVPTEFWGVTSRGDFERTCASSQFYKFVDV